MIKFEKGKKYKFDKDKYIERYDEDTYKASQNLWISDIENIEFTIKKDYEEEEIYYFTKEEAECSYGVHPSWCREVE